MEAAFSVRAIYTVTGQIKDAPRIPLHNGDYMIPKEFETEVFPLTRTHNEVPRMLIRNLISFTGPRYRKDATPSHLRGEERYVIPGDDEIPVWVRAIADRIESTECPRPGDPADLVL